MEKDEPDSLSGPAGFALRRARVVGAGLLLALAAVARAAAPVRIEATPSAPFLLTPAAALSPAPLTASALAPLSPSALSPLSTLPPVAVGPAVAPAVVPAGSALTPRLPAATDGPAPYGLPAARPRASRPHEPTEDEVRRMRAEYLRIARDGEEIFDAPSWIAKIVNPELKAAFQIAAAEDMMIDVANGVHAEVPVDMKGDVVAGLAKVRRDGWRRWVAARRQVDEQPRTDAQRYALTRLELLHRSGLAPSGFDRPGDDAPAARAAYARLLALASGKADVPVAEAREDVKAYARFLRAATDPIRRGPEDKDAAAVAADAVLASTARAAAAEAKRLYEDSLAQAKDPKNADNLRHLVARLAANRAGTLMGSPNLGKQVRPSCTLHMLRGLLASLGVKKDMATLVREAREVLGDPYVGATTAFDESMQRRLFAHYGTVHEVPRGGLFRVLVGQRRAIKIRIQIGDPVYQHSLILEGFYELDGKTYASLRDSTSYFPTRMELSDFAKVLSDDPALYFESLTK